NQKLSERNGSDPWLFTYREAWLRLLAQDFHGARRVCEELRRSSMYPTGQAETIGRLASGFEALDHRQWDKARQHFEEVRDPHQTPKFFIHWYWRMHAHIGLVRACLGSAHFADARIEADRLIETALKCADPNLQALAWEARAQVAIAESDWTQAA